MIYKYDKNLVAAAKTLRKNMTHEEKHLWYDFLKKLPVTVNRQKNIGNYIVDFFIATKRIVIEIDGAQHQVPKNWKADKIRDFELQQLGITVLRYSNRDVNDHFQVVCMDILKHLGLQSSDLRKDK
ncbi:MAG: DUF559 domain-containing protein [Clostridia bacterium]|nr:DUF559 domain-containing protein [Clostridia bacterium]